MPEEGPRLRYSDHRDYVDQFRALLATAVEDRLRTRSAAVFMSGGLDSPMVAAVARERMAAVGPGCRLEALTVCHDNLPADQECYLATLAARHIGIPVNRLVVDGDLSADDASRSWSWLLEAEAPEPALLGSIGPDVLGYQEAAAIGRVILTGWDGDALLGVNVGALWWARMWSGELRSLASEVGWHLRARKLPRVGFRAGLRRIREGGPKRVFGEYPSWLAPGLEKGLDLRGRWLASQAAPDPGRTVRGRARNFLSTPVWRSVLDPADPGMSGMPLEQRHPLIDLRLVSFALSSPPIPWCVEKELFRVAMRGDLPDQVLRRPKTPFAGDPLVSGLGDIRVPVAHDLTPELGDYVDVKKYLAAMRDLAHGGTPVGPASLCGIQHFCSQRLAAESLEGGRFGHMTRGTCVEIIPKTVVCALGDHLSSDLGEETVILHMDEGIYFGLDEVGTRIWKLIQEPRQVGEVCDQLQAEYEVEAGHCEEAVLRLLREMSEAGLIEATGG